MINLRMGRRLEKLLVQLLLVFFLVPLLLAGTMRLFPQRSGWIRALSQGPVTATAPAPVPASWAKVKSGKYQAALAKNFDASWPGCEALARYTREMYLRLFHASAPSIVVGKNRSLYFNESPFEFVNEYCVRRVPAPSLQWIVDGLRQWRECCLSRGVGFAVIVTPTKASIYPEDLPLAWRRRYDPRPRAYEQFVELMRAGGVPCIDGHVLIASAKRDAPAPVFPLGGAHWSQYASFLGANAILREFQNQGQPVRPIENARTVVSNDPQSEDCDMLKVIQPAIPWHYPVVTMNYPPVPLPDGRRPSLVVIGGSFLNTMTCHLHGSGQFSETHWLRYYKQAKEALVGGGGWKILGVQMSSIDVERELFAAGCVVLEISEQQLTDAVHLQQLFKDTLSILPARGAPRSLFAYSACQPCEWDKPLDFTRQDSLIAGSFDGLAVPEVHGRMSDQPETNLRLTVPSVDQDVVLTASTGAFIIPGKLPIQRVSVFANDHPVAEWTYGAMGMGENRAVIPRACLGDGRVALRFHYAQTTSPAENDPRSGDQRRLALVFGNVALHRAYRRMDGPVISAAAPGAADEVFAEGFSPKETDGRWTDSAQATLRLPLPPCSEGDVVLSAAVNAALDTRLLPVQRASLFVRDQPVGEWEFIVAGAQWREIRIPRTLLDGDGTHVAVQLRFNKTFVPDEISHSGDKRRLALFFREVRMHGFAPPDERAATSPAGGTEGKSP